MERAEDQERQQLGEDIVAAVQRMGVASRRVGDVFAAREGLHATDLEALLHVMQAQARNDPPTAGALAASLGVSTGAATAVIDRLERAGHVRRHRDEHDRRKVIVRYSDAARAVAGEFFGPLTRLTDEVLDTFTTAELHTVARFLGAYTDAMDRHVHDARRGHRG
ncbi:MarR family winged helix-turn-helix transcriptional regulator [Actinomycetospora straminea]|uniref:MarR family transcriptional regulator n=1 Tax=Actinomycetospora straminea TaxID=663607 RepID=A0ABP9E814_9PSEU|nr:MarR family transcriptional regulator [Actinomycetospora straminea]MDD7932738.1 MarR family transcriptional regulator [Actinomycetospora straminea]